MWYLLGYYVGPCCRSLCYIFICHLSVLISFTFVLSSTFVFLRIRAGRGTCLEYNSITLPCPFVSLFVGWRFPNYNLLHMRMHVIPLAANNYTIHTWFIGDWPIGKPETKIRLHLFEKDPILEQQNRTDVNKIYAKAWIKIHEVVIVIEMRILQ